MSGGTPRSRHDPQRLWHTDRRNYGFFVRDSSKTGAANVHYARREDAELASDKLAYLHEAELDGIAFESISPTAKGDWLNQSNTISAR